jgi:putative membrane protein
MQPKFIAMPIAAKILIAIVALEHIYILWLEMFVWTTVGRKTFKTMPPELFEPTKSMAANQGLYNGFLAAGLIWSLVIADPAWAHHVALFFLWCVIGAGVYGGITVQRSIFVIQAVPAIIAALAVLFL